MSKRPNLQVVEADPLFPDAESELSHGLDVAIAAAVRRGQLAASRKRNVFAEMLPADIRRQMRTLRKLNERRAA